MLKNTTPFSLRKKIKVNKVALIDEYDVGHAHEFVILAATYNKAKYLIEWGKSIVAQNFRPISVVLIDDCSKDDTISKLLFVAEMFKKSGVSYRFIKSIKRKHCASAYRTTLEFAFPGKYFGIVDADDMLMPDAVKSVVNMYIKYPTISFIYTQFKICSDKGDHLKNGWCCAPLPGQSLLDYGDSQHSFSHWRTFSSKLAKPSKLWMDGLKCAIDKYMGYRLEELGNGLFFNQVCYIYRQSVKGAITSREDTKTTWRNIIREAKKRRQRNGLVVFPIVERTS